MDDHNTHMLYLPHMGIFRFSSTMWHCVLKICKCKISLLQYIVSNKLRQPVRFPCVTLQACFNSAELLDCFRNTLCILFRHMPPAIRHLSIIDSCLIMQWQGVCQRQTVFNKQKSLYRVMRRRFPQNKGYSHIKILSSDSSVSLN